MLSAFILNLHKELLELFKKYVGVLENNIIDAKIRTEDEELQEALDSPLSCPLGPLSGSWIINEAGYDWHTQEFK